MHDKDDSINDEYDTSEDENIPLWAIDPVRINKENFDRNEHE